MPPMPPQQTHCPGSHCFVVTPGGQRLGLMLRWAQRPVDVPQHRRTKAARAEPYTEWHGDVHYLDLDEDGEWVVRHEWVHASRLIGAGSRNVSAPTHTTVDPRDAKRG